MNLESKGEFVTLARVVKTQGRHGEVAAEVHSDVPDRFAEGMQLFALLKEGSEQGRRRKEESDRSAGSERFSREVTRRELAIESLWPHKGLLVLKFAGVDSISQAEALLGSELQVPAIERAQLDPGWTYVSDLAGCSVLDRGREIGRIAKVEFGAGEAPLLVVVNSAGKKFDVPFAEAYLEGVDTARKQVQMCLPEGMLDINAPTTAEEKREQAKQQPQRSQRSLRK